MTKRINFAKLGISNIQSQQESAKIAGEQEQALQKDKLAAEKDLKDFEYTKQKEIEFIRVYGQIASKDETGQLARMMLPIMQQLVPNITIPLAAENKQMGEAIVAQAQQQQMAAAHQYAQEQQENEMGTQEPPQQEMPNEQMEQQPQMQ